MAAIKILASRDLRVTNRRQRIRVIVGRPAKSGHDWRCAFLLRGLDDEVRYGHGIDSLQALQEAIYGAGLILRRSALKFRWVGEVGWLGFPMRVPEAHGQRFARHVERIVDREEKALVARRRKRAR